MSHADRDHPAKISCVGAATSSNAFYPARMWAYVFDRAISLLGPSLHRTDIEAVPPTSCSAAGPTRSSRAATSDRALVRATHGCPYCAASEVPTEGGLEGMAPRAGFRDEILAVKQHRANLPWRGGTMRRGDDPVLESCPAEP